MGCGASSEAKDAPPRNPDGAQPTKGGAGGEAPVRQPSATEPSKPTPAGGEAPQAASSSASVASEAPAPSKAASTAASGASLASGAKLAFESGGSVLSSVAGALATRNPDGSWDLKSSLGPVSLASGPLKSIAGKIVYGCSEVLKSTQAGVVLFTVLDATFRAFHASASKPQWLSEHMLYLKSVEGECVAGREVFRRQGFLLLLSEELRSTQKTVESIAARGAVGSFVFSGSDQDALAASRVRIESIKEQALQGMLVDLKEDTAATGAELATILAKLREGKEKGWMSSELQKASQEVEDSRSLARLLAPQVFDADLASRAAQFCPGTRAKVLADFDQWVRLKPEWTTSRDGYDEARERVFFITGAPGTGKSTLAAHIAQRYAGSIHALHLCDHSMPSRREPLAALKSLLYQLANSIPTLKRGLLMQLSKRRSDGSTLRSTISSGGVKDVKEFFSSTIGRGLWEVNALAAGETRQGKEQGVENAGAYMLPACVTQSADGSNAAKATKLLILVDSLDESGPNSFGSGDDDLVRLLGDKDLLSKLPPWVGIVVTSRPEERILRSIGVVTGGVAHELSTESEENLSDLSRVLRARLEQRGVEPPEDTDKALQILLRKSEGNFLYASSVLGADNTPLTLATVEQLPEGMGQLYARTFARIAASFRASGGEDGSEGRVAPNQASEAVQTLSSASPGFKHAMWMLRVILAAHEPLTLASLAHLMRLSIESVQRVLEPMRSLLPLDDSSSTPDAARVRLFHKSLRDWLIDPSRRSNDDEAHFWVDLRLGHALLTRACVERLFVEPAAVEEAGKKDGAEASTPLLRVQELKRALVAESAASSASSEGFDECYAVRWGARHALAHGSMHTARALLLSLQFLSLRVDAGQAADFLRDFHLALRMLEGRHTRADLDSLRMPIEKEPRSSTRRGAGASSTAAPGSNGGLVENFRSMKRFLQAEVRHLTHGVEAETQAALAFQYAFSYPDTHEACKQASEPALKRLWAESAGGESNVDWVEWRNKPSSLSAMLESWTDIAGSILSLAFHPSASSGADRMVTGGDDGCVTLWNAATGEIERTWILPARVSAVQFMPDSTSSEGGDVVVACCDDGFVRAFDSARAEDEPLSILPSPEHEEEEEEKEQRPGALTSLTFSSDGGSSYILCGSADGHVYVYARKTLRLACRLLCTAGVPVTSVVYSHASPAERRAAEQQELHEEETPAPGVIVATSADGSVRKWSFDLASGKATAAEQSWSHGAPLLCVAFSPDNSTLAAGSADGLVVLLDAATLQPRMGLGGHVGPVTSVDFHPQGGMVASGGHDESVRLFDVVSGETISVYEGHHKAVQVVRFSSADGGLRLASGGADESVRLWDSRSRVAPSFVANSVRDNTCWNLSGLALTSDGSRLVSSSEDRMMRTWDATSGLMLAAVTNLPHVAHFVAFAGREESDEKRRVVLASRDSDTVVLYEGGTTLKCSVQAGSPVVGLAVSSDSSQVAVVCADRNLRVYSISAEEDAAMSESCVVSLPASPLAIGAGSDKDCWIVSLSDGSMVRVVGGSAQAPVVPSVDSSRSPVRSCVSQGGSLVASADADGSLLVMDSSSGARVGSLKLRASSRGVVALHFASDDLLFVACGNFLTFVWRFRSGGDIPLQLFAHDDQVSCLASHAASGLFVSGGLDNCIAAWSTGRLAHEEVSPAAADGSSVRVGHSFLFETERATPTGSMHLYQCNVGANKLNMPPVA